MISVTAEVGGNRAASELAGLPVRRVLLEAKDGMQRAMRARAVDAAAQ